jgi:hypothetical protein
MDIEGIVTGDSENFEKPLILTLRNGIEVEGFYDKRLNVWTFTVPEIKQLCLN